MPNLEISPLPGYEKQYREWLFALDSRLKYSEEAIKQGDTKMKEDAIAYLLGYIKESPPSCDDLDIIAANQIEIIDLNNIATQIAKMQINRIEYLKIVDWVNKKFPERT